RIVSVGCRGNELLLEASTSGMPIAACQLDDVGTVPRLAVHIDHEADRLVGRYAQAVGVAPNDLGRDLTHRALLPLPTHIGAQSSSSPVSRFQRNRNTVRSA